MRILFTLLIFCFYSISFSQVASEKEIKELAEYLNDELQGVYLGNGVSIRGCMALNRTLTYLYDVDEYWHPKANIKEEILANLKGTEDGNMFFENEIDVDFYYYYNDILQKKISIKSHELSNLRFNLGEYISIKDHPKAKGVNMKIKAPNGWKIEEGVGPNIIKKFVYNNNSYSLLVTENFTFFSRNQARELIEDDEYRNEVIEGATSSLHNLEVINQDIVTINSYPALVFTAKGSMERSGVTFNLIFKNWFIYYEDKIVLLQCGGNNNSEFSALEGLYNLITNSVIFPEQFEY